MHRQMHTQPRRDPCFAQTYRAESVRMHDASRPRPEPKPETPMRDASVILPLLLLLMTEGADRYLLLALLYILM